MKPRACATSSTAATSSKCKDGPICSTGGCSSLVEQIRRVNPDQDKGQGFREEDCILCAPRPVEEMWSELEQLIQHVRDPFVRELLQRITTQHAEKLRIWPAALTVHHAYRGGFLEHILSVARSALTLGAAYGAEPGSADRRRAAARHRQARRARVRPRRRATRATAISSGTSRSAP